jgi:hypothetical protein
VPQELNGKKVTIKASFDLGPLNAGGKALLSPPVEVQL